MTHACGTGIADVSRAVPPPSAPCTHKSQFTQTSVIICSHYSHLYLNIVSGETKNWLEYLYPSVLPHSVLDKYTQQMFVKYFPEAAFPLFAFASVAQDEIKTRRTLLPAWEKVFLIQPLGPSLCFEKHARSIYNDTNKHISHYFVRFGRRVRRARTKREPCERDGAIRVVAVLFGQIINIFLSTHHVYLFIIN